MNDKSLFLSGFPETGKTTFLAALWYLVNSSEIESSLQLEYLDGNREYLNSIRDEWQSCKKVGRTTGSDLKPISMKLIDKKLNQTVNLNIPDVPGEECDRMFEDRKCFSSFKRLFDTSIGILLFIHPNKVVEPQSILSSNRKMKLESSVEGMDLNLNPWNKKEASTQVKLVDILQFIFDNNTSDSKKRLAIIISAWDIIQKIQNVRSEYNTPLEWVKNRLPLLSQYIISNADVFDTMYYGISAQGGDLEKDSEKLLLKASASNRIIVVNQNSVESNDLTEPIKWLMKFPS